MIYSTPVKGTSVFWLLVFSTLTGFQVSAESKILSFSSSCHIIRQVWISIFNTKKGIIRGERGSDGGWIIRLECCLQWACSSSIAQRTTKRWAQSWSLAVFWSSQQQHFRWVYFSDKDGVNGLLMFVHRHRISKYMQTDIIHDFIDKMNHG